MLIVIHRLGAVLQSNQSLDIDDSFEVDIGVMKGDDAGGGGSNRKITDTDLLSDNCTIKKKTSMVFIPSIENEYLCAARAIVTCVAKLHKTPATQFKKLIAKDKVNSKTPHSQRSRAINLHKDADVSMEGPVAIGELRKFEDFLNVQIIVVSGDTDNQVIYTGMQRRKKKIYLYFKDEHFHSIINIQGFFVNKKFCDQCYKVYGKNFRHSCEYVCRTCSSHECLFQDDSIMCDDCNMICRNTACYIRHKQTREYTVGSLRGQEMPSLCEKMYRCKQCNKIFDRHKRDISSHKCGEYYCTCCNTYVTDEHLCYFKINL